MSRWGGIVALALAAACGGPSQAAEPVAPQSPPPPPQEVEEPEPEPAMDYFTEDLDTGENLIPALKIGAERLECGLVGEEGQKVVYECPSALIVILLPEESSITNCSPPSVSSNRILCPA